MSAARFRTIGTPGQGLDSSMNTSAEGEMADIEVKAVQGDEYEVDVTEGSSSTRHLVTVDSAALKRFGGGAPAERLLEESFRFLLEREPKEAILRRFELSVIGSYFPEYGREILRRMSAE